MWSAMRLRIAVWGTVREFAGDDAAGVRGDDFARSLEFANEVVCARVPKFAAFVAQSAFESLADSARASTSSTVMRPPSPVPWINAASRPRSARRRVTAGLN